MNRLIIFAIFLVAIPISFAWSASFPTYRIVQDTVIQNDTISITPYFRKTPFKTLGNFGVVSSDKIAFQTYAGFNVLNTLRGHIPNFSIGPNTSSSTTGLRSGESLLVIDGLPYNAGFSNYYNLNSFEYKSLYAVSNGNGAALYGGGAANGAFFLTSKTGEGFRQPSIEFNSSSSVVQTERSFLTGKTETSNQTVLTNTMAYQQDFGLVDTRVSYTNSYLPDGSTSANTKTSYNTLRVNTGFNIASRFSARLILDGLHTKSLSSQVANFGLGSFLSASETIRKNFQGTLQLKYQPFHWLRLSSQSSLGQIENNRQTTLQTSSTADQKQNREFANLFASVNKSIFSDLSFTAFAGFQYEKVKTKQQSQSVTSMSQSRSENKTTSALGGVGLQYKDYLFLDFNYRQDYFSVFASDRNSEPTYSINSSFVFSDAFSWNNSWFSFGKVRSSIGKNSVAVYQGYPIEFINYATVVNVYPNPDFHASKKQMFELGTDLGFAHNRITFNASYFSNHHDEIPTRLAVPWSSNSTAYVLANVLTIDSKGWELILGATSIKKSNFSLDTKLIWSTYKTEVTASNNMNTANIPFPEIRGGIIITNQPIGNPGSGISLGNPYPDWTGSLLNQITFKNFFASFLIDIRKGGVFYSADYSTTFPTFTSQDGTTAKLRDLSFGYKLSSNVLDKIHIREAQLSLSGRNLWTLYSKSDQEVENSVNNPLQKSGTLSLTLMF